MEKRYRKTCRRFNRPREAHYLTFSCFGRRPFLARDRAPGWLVDSLRRGLEKHEMLLWAWVIKPEHVHVLVYPRRETNSISEFLRSVKKPVTSKALRYVRRYAPGFEKQMLDVQPDGTCCSRFWQRGGGYDTNLWTPKFIWEKIHYIHQNPVRRGLVKVTTEWEWSIARDFVGETGSLPVDRESIPSG